MKIERDWKLYRKYLKDKENELAKRNTIGAVRNAKQ